MIRTKIKQFLLILLLPVICATLAIFIQSSSSVKAANLSNFNPGRIIDDAVFYNKDAMDVAAIQAFLNSKVPYCDTYTDNHVKAYEAAPCLKDYRETTNTKSANAYCNGYGVLNQSAAEIIYGVAQSCGINPQVIIVTLQKEQGLVTDTWPRDSWLAKVSGVNHQYRSAMGYGCPDTAVCDSTYYGFFNQVYTAAQQFKRYRATPNAYSYVAGRNNNIPWNKDTLSCGYSSVFIENQATAGLYNYTPYRPNQAALNAGYGAGDYCSSHGNRNFYNYFTDWFGSTNANYAPQSNLHLPPGNYTLLSLIPGNMALDLSETNTTRIMPATGSPAQYFYISEYGSTGYYTIKHVSSGKYLSTSANSEPGQAITLNSSTITSCNEKWSLQENEDGSLNILSACFGLSLDVSGGVSSSSGTTIHLWNKHAEQNQKWQILSWNSSAIETGNYTITTTGNSNIALDVSGGSHENGADVQVWTKNNTMAQKFSIKKLQDGSFTITNISSNKSVDVYGRSHENGANVHIWQQNTSCAQRWYIQKNTDNSHRLISACSGKVLDVYGADLNPGGDIGIWEDNQTIAQKWEFEKTDF